MKVVIPRCCHQQTFVAAAQVVLFPSLADQRMVLNHDCHKVSYGVDEWMVLNLQTSANTHESTNLVLYLKNNAPSSNIFQSVVIKFRQVNFNFI